MKNFYFGLLIIILSNTLQAQTGYVEFQVHDNTNWSLSSELLPKDSTLSEFFVKSTVQVNTSSGRLQEQVALSLINAENEITTFDTLLNVKSNYFNYAFLEDSLLYVTVSSSTTNNFYLYTYNKNTLDVIQRDTFTTIDNKTVDAFGTMAFVNGDDLYIYGSLINSTIRDVTTFVCKINLQTKEKIWENLYPVIRPGNDRPNNLSLLNDGSLFFMQEGRKATPGAGPPPFVDWHNVKINPADGNIIKQQFHLVVQSDDFAPWLQNKKNDRILFHSSGFRWLQTAVPDRIYQYIYGIDDTLSLVNWSSDPLPIVGDGPRSYRSTNIYQDDDGFVYLAGSLIDVNRYPHACTYGSAFLAKFNGTTGERLWCRLYYHLEDSPSSPDGYECSVIVPLSILVDEDQQIVFSGNRTSFEDNGQHINSWIMRLDENGCLSDQGGCEQRIAMNAPAKSNHNFMSPGYVWNNFKNSRRDSLGMDLAMSYRVSEVNVGSVYYPYFDYFPVEGRPAVARDSSDFEWQPSEILLKRDNGIIYYLIPPLLENDRYTDSVLNRTFTADQREGILYDFTLEVGDTFRRPPIYTPSFLPESYHDLVVTNIDTATLNNGETRRRWTLEFIDPFLASEFAPIVWLEGMGSTHGFLCDTETRVDFDRRPVLGCYSRYGEVLFSNDMGSTDDCLLRSVITSTDTPSNDQLTNRFKVYPNPTTGEVSIEGVLNNFEIQLFSVSGRLMKTYENDNTLNLGALPNGLYLLNLTTKDGYRQVTRVVLRR